MFTKESALVKLWVRYIRCGVYSVGDVPAIANLREAIQEALAV